MNIYKTLEETRLEVRALIKYILEEDPDPTFAEERIMVMIRNSYEAGRLDEEKKLPHRFRSIEQHDFRKIPL